MRGGGSFKFFDSSTRWERERGVFLCLCLQVFVIHRHTKNIALPDVLLNKMESSVPPSDANWAHNAVLGESFAGRKHDHKKETDGQGHSTSMTDESRIKRNNGQDIW